jgi:hypothetical protein
MKSECGESQAVCARAESAAKKAMAEIKYNIEVRIFPPGNLRSICMA